jgi:hypothetical protein
LLDINAIEKELQKLWARYQAILANPNWEDLNEARAILYSVGCLYCETIAPEAIERRLHLLKKPMKLLDFLTAIDSQSKELKEMRKDLLFVALEKFYVVIKNFKNKYGKGKLYLDEDRFIKLYNAHNPDKKLTIGERGTLLKIKKARR